jgi:hypothetical protein
MKSFIVSLLLCAALTGHVFGDGFMSRPLEEALLATDAIILVEITQNESTTQRRPGATKEDRDTVDYTNNIKATVIGNHWGNFAGDVFNAEFSRTLVPGVWLLGDASGLEDNMTPGNEYVLLLRRTEGTYRLQRAEEGKKLDEILRLRKEIDDEDRQNAEALKRIPNGLYYFSVDKNDLKVRFEEGHRFHLGRVYEPKIVQRKLAKRFSLFLLTLTLQDKPPSKCIMVVDGKAYLAFDDCWAAERARNGVEDPPRLFVGLKDEPSAKAVGAFWGVQIENSNADCNSQLQNAEKGNGEQSLAAESR